MSANVLSFWRARPTAAPHDWTQTELAQFYRVEAALLRAGLRVETERGLSDEGEPWFAFCRTEDGEVAIHFARIDGEYVVAGMMGQLLARGHDFDALIGAIISRHPAVRPDAEKGSNVIMHPAMWLVALVAAALLKVSDARADEKSPLGHDGDRVEKRGAAPHSAGSTVNGTGFSQGGSSGGTTGSSHFFAVFEPAHVAAIVAAAGFAMADSVFSKPAGTSPSTTGGTATLKIFDPAAYMSASGAASGRGYADSGIPHEAEGASHIAPVLGEAAAAKLLSLLAVLWTTPSIGGMAQPEIGITIAAALLDLGGAATGTPSMGVEISHEHTVAAAGLQQFAAPHESVRDNAAQAEATPPPSAPSAAKAAAAGGTPASTSAPATTGTSGTVTASTSTTAEQHKSEPVLVVEVTKAPVRSNSSLPDVVAVKVAVGDRADDTTTLSFKFDKLPADVAKLLDTAVKFIEPMHETPAAAPAKAPAPADPAKADPAPAKGSIEDKLVAKVLEAVASFKAATPDYKLSLEGNHVVYYDLEAVLHHGPKIQSETWAFSDGSSVSLVGLNLGHHDAMF